MKPILKLYGLVLVSVLAILFSGCAATKNALYGREVIEIPGEVIKTNTVVVTNIVVIEATTNAQTGAVTAPVIQHVLTPTITYEYAPTRYQTNLTTKPLISGSIDAVGAVPVPFAGLGAILLGWAYSGYAAWRNKKYTVVALQSVDAGRRILRETPEGRALDEKFKSKLSEYQAAAGILGVVNDVLKKHTAKQAA